MNPFFSDLNLSEEPNLDERFAAMVDSALIEEVETGRLPLKVLKPELRTRLGLEDK